MKAMNKGKSYVLSLMDNAKESLDHAIEHLTASTSPSGKDIKRVILDVSQVVELILKEKVRQIHPVLIWENVDKYPSRSGQMIGTEKALARLSVIGGVTFSDEFKETVRLCRKLRNSIEHYEVEFEFKEARIIIGRILSFVFSFTKKNLGVDWEKESIADVRWKALLSLAEFYDVHCPEIEKRLSEANISVCECPYCRAMTFVEDASQCELCGHIEEKVICEECGKECWESQIRIVEDLDGDENNWGICRILFCEECLEKMEIEAAKMEAVVDQIREK
jgi:hypothetical protein